MSDRHVTGRASVSQVSGRGMITLRGNLGAAKLKATAKAATGLAIPARGCFEAGTGRVLAWMSPDELLIMVPSSDVSDTLGKLSASLKGVHALVADVSDARAVFRVGGADAREVMAKITPVDLHPEAFQAGQFRRTRLAQVAGALWMPEDDVFEVICFRSVADYVHTLLTTSATAAVGAFPRAPS